MANITLSKAIERFAEELGSSGEDSRASLVDEITNGIEVLLFNGGGSILREWKVPVRGGSFVLPRDLETPVKFKFSKYANLGFGTFQSSYFSFGSQGITDMCDFYDWEANIAVRSRKVATQFSPPAHGVRLVATTKNPRDVGKALMVSGKQRGFDIVGVHNDIKTNGEYLTIYREDDDKKNYSSYSFDEITSIVKDLTCDYVMLSGIDCNEEFYHLAHIHPDDEAPSYTECEVYTCPCWSAFGISDSYTACDATLHILGRVNPSIRYLRDEDILPITSFEMLNLLAKRARYDSSGDFNEVDKVENRLKILIKKQVAYQQQASKFVSVGLKGSGASLTNL